MQRESEERLDRETEETDMLFRPVVQSVPTERKVFKQ